MIKSRARQTLFMDFSNLKVQKGSPSDVDFMYNGGKFLLIAEIKNELGTFTEEQKHLYEDLADNHKKDTYVVFITHDKFVEKGDTSVDVAECKVVEYYFNKRWRIPRNISNFQEFVTTLEMYYW